MEKDKELELVIEKGLKRLCLVCCIFATIFILPTLFFVNSEYFLLIFFSSMVLLLIGMRISPWIVRKIWK